MNTSNYNDKIYQQQWTDEELKNKDNKRDFIRIVHISDTHNAHFQNCAHLPYGDILIHSGDFTFKNDWKQHSENANANANDIPQSLHKFNDLLATWPHPTKLVIAGNHEMKLHNFSASDIQKNILTNAIYLQDSSYILKNVLESGRDIHFYGSPWTTSRNMGFSASSRTDIAEKFSRIPRDTHILITHMPPHNVLDVAWSSKQQNNETCVTCGKKHPNGRHWGNEYLRQLVDQYHAQHRLLLHCFGHVHEFHQVVELNGMLYSNASMPYDDQSANVIDIPLRLFR